ncbi:MAG: CRISPR-associated helicase Cas3' [Ignavibacteriaceae bacterium]|nr:CRISPR-associated helicase Cas3' [Ignavibacteriaceae bacterium]
MDTTHDIKYNNLSHLLWAKTSENNYHPLVYHSLDIAATTEILIKKYFSPARKQFIKNYFLDSDYNEIEKLLIYFAALHDIGKATPVFQAKNDFMKNLLEEGGYSFQGLISMPEDIRHNFLSEWWVRKNITKLIPQEIDTESLSSITRAIGGHHGVFSKPDLRKKITLRQFGLNSNWEEGRESISNVLKEVLNMSSPPHNNPICITGSKTVFTYWFAGLITLADWIASMDEYFTFNSQIQDFCDYYQKSKEIAEKALNNSGFNQWHNPDKLQPFPQLFFGYSPRIQQTTVFDLIEKEIDQKKTALIIIEAPMGIGKTETAFYAAELLNSKSEQTGVFIGMPTQATSNQMYKRFKNFLETRLPKKFKGNIELLHSASMLFLEDSKKMPVIEGVAIEESDENILSNDWFKPKKRGLLSQFAVGTVDQLLMGVLQTKHNYLRLFGLNTKTVILDEVHSYDLYMNGLLQRFLNWASNLEINVIILSATLPKATTEKLVNAYSKNLKEVSFVEYPRVTVAQLNKTVSYKLEPPEKKPVNLEYINDFSPEKLYEIVAGSFKPDGCIAIICNSVKKSQEFYELFKSKLENAGIKVLLLHSRFTAQRRNEIEGELISYCGKGANKPNKILVIATQIIEQSLDIDFDLIITES